MITSEHFGKRLKIIREGRNISQAELARRLGTNHSYVSKIERGECIPSMSSLCRLAEAYATEAWKIVRFIEKATDVEIGLPVEVSADA